MNLTVLLMGSQGIKSMRVWHLRDLPLSGCIQAGNVIEGAIKGYEEEKTKCKYSFSGVKKVHLKATFI